MLRVVIANFDSRLNYGSAAILDGIIEVLKELDKEVEITVFTSHPQIQLEQSWVKKMKAPGTFYLQKRLFPPKETIVTCILLSRCIAWWVGKKGFNLDFKFLRDTVSLREYYSADVVLSAGGDTLADYQWPFSFLSNVNKFLFALLLETPVILISDSIGPFKTWLMKRIGLGLLNKCQAIILREPRSQEYLLREGVKAPIKVTADLAFLLKPSPRQEAGNILRSEGLREANKGIIGLSVSNLVYTYGLRVDNPTQGNDYIDLLARVVNEILAKTEHEIVFVPHVIEPDSDDRVVADEVIKRAGKQGNNRILSIHGDFGAHQIKAIIGECSFFIGFRLHACLDAISMGVPTVPIIYGHKGRGIIRDQLNYSYGLDLEELTFEKTMAAVNEAWKNRESIALDLAVKREAITLRALSTTTVLRQYLRLP